VSLLGTTAPDFSDPLGLLAACHQRILSQCELLEHMQPWLQSRGVDRQARESAQRVLRYFNTAGVLHHQDEELDLFPMLGDGHDSRVLIDRLCAEHRDLERRWAELALQLEGLLNDHYDREAFDIRVAAFCAGYRRHIEVEDNLLLVQAKDLLSTAQVRQLGESMAARRRSNRGPAHK
jgi:hemerythrin-like domain-containing protein